jgi:probable DNA repair protein
LNGKRLPQPIREGLASGATLLCASAQRQAALRAAWAEEQRDSGQTLWRTPRILTFNLFAEQALDESWAAAGQPDRLLAPGAEWAALREWRRNEGGSNAEARALLNAVRMLSDWRLPASANALGGSPEGELLLAALDELAKKASIRGRKALRDWLPEISARGPLLACGLGIQPAAQREALQRWGATLVEPGNPGSASDAAQTDIKVVTAENDDQELELIASWCRAQLEQDGDRRLLIVDARLRQRRGLYDRLLSQTLSPSQWLRPEARDASPVYAFEGGRPFTEFPVIVHALLTLRLLTSRLRFDELVYWLRLPFLDGTDHLAGAAVEAQLRQGRKLEASAEELAQDLERSSDGAAAGLAARLRLAIQTLAGDRRSPAEWSPRILQALRQLGWHGSRPLRSDEQQAVARFHALLDEFSALGAWVPDATPADAVSLLGDLAAERQFDPASVSAPITLTDSHDDPVVRYDAIWVAGLDAAQWPAAPRPDVFIPLRLQVAAGVPSASARGQAQIARRSLSAWRAATGELVCSWARLEGDAHRAISPLLAPMARTEDIPAAPQPQEALSSRLRQLPLESFEDVEAPRVDTREVVRGGVTPLALQAECGFHAYAQVRLRAEALETPAPGLDARERGMLLHKALELIWIKLANHFNLAGTDERVRRPMIADSVEAAVASVFRGYVPIDLRPAVEREKHRLEKLIESLMREESRRPYFVVEAMEARRQVTIAGGTFELRIDRIDSIEGGYHAILDYKSGEPRAPRWQDERIRDPQLLAYLMAEAGRNVQALANVSLANGRAKFSGRSSRTGLLPGVRGFDDRKVPAEDIERAWQADLERWLLQLANIATDYIAGHAPVQPAADVCRNCHLTILCRRIELLSSEPAAGDLAGDDHGLE